MLRAIFLLAFFFPATARTYGTQDQQVLWFSPISLAPNCTESDHYLSQYEIALLSWQATKNTFFDPHLVVHVPEGTTEASLSSHLQQRLQHIRELGAKTVIHSLSFISSLHGVPKEENVSDVECLAGTFLRLDVPEILDRNDVQKDQHLKNYALFTDLDIIWWRKVEREEFLASAPSTSFSLAFSSQMRQKEGPRNAGVVLFNVPNYRRDMPHMLAAAMVVNQQSPDLNPLLSAYLSTSLDQGTLNHFYDTEGNTGRRFLADKWNYKMFWDGRDHVAIVHLWGVRPSEGLSCWIRTRDQRRCPPIDQGMIPSQKDYLQDMALSLAVAEDPELRFMRSVVATFARYNQTRQGLHSTWNITTE